MHAVVDGDYVELGGAEQVAFAMSPVCMQLQRSTYVQYMQVDPIATPVTVLLTLQLASCSSLPQDLDIYVSMYLVNT